MPDFAKRYQLDESDLLTLFLWSEEEFLKKTEGSAIRRIGYQQWLRNIAIALGNAPPSADIVNALQRRKAETSDLVQEHIEWALDQQRKH